MTATLAIPVFLVSLAVTLAAASVFANGLDRVGVRLGMPEALLGLLTAMAADGPEITSALVALLKGAHGVSFGVVAGSNLFNLAAMIGLSAILAGRVHLPHAALLLEGTVALLCTVVAAALVLGLIPAIAALLCFAAVLVPYVAVLVRGPEILRRLPESGRVARRLARALAAREHAPTRTMSEELAAWRHAVEIVAAAALIIGGSIGLVESALALADAWHIPRLLVGVLILAPLTSLPNAFTAVRLGLARRGSALVSETLNSNTINLAGGVVLPALVVSVAASSTSVRVDLAFLVAMTIGSLALLNAPRGMGRVGGAALVGVYLGYVATQVLVH